jgi:uncharacterized ParB-like nuclease family protein
MRRRAPERLEVIDDATGWAAVAERRPLGVRPIPLDSITGTVEALKARTFDAGLRPAASARDRWRAVWLAQARGAELPPIAVYRVDGRHVLRDGHHRASAARALGRERIEAEVIELRRAVSPAGAPSSSATRRRDALPRRPVAC